MKSAVAKKETRSELLAELAGAEVQIEELTAQVQCLEAQLVGAAADMGGAGFYRTLLRRSEAICSAQKEEIAELKAELRLLRERPAQEYLESRPKPGLLSRGLRAVGRAGVSLLSK